MCTQQRVVTTELGDQYTLDLIAIRELQAAQNAADAEAIFMRFAPQVPRRHRMLVWLAVDDVEDPAGYILIEGTTKPRKGKR